MVITNPTLIGHVASVSSSVVRVKIRSDMESTLIMIGGSSHRVGQIGSFLRIPLGYTNLYAICTQIGTDAAPPVDSRSNLNIEIDEKSQELLSSYSWMTVILFGESLSGKFERGVAQYPTVGDEVHVVTNVDLKIIYDWKQGIKDTQRTVPVGTIASTSGITAELDIAKLVSRHCTVVGSTGSGKSNLVTVLLEAVSGKNFPNARTIVIDPHGEYTTALEDKACVFRVNPKNTDEKPLWVPFWTLPFTELQNLTFGNLESSQEAAIRDQVLAMKKKATQFLKRYPPLETLTADSPIPFSINQLWFNLVEFETCTFSDKDKTKKCDLLEDGDPEQLKPPRYPPASPYNQVPYKNPGRRGIERKLDFMLSRLRDERFSFLFKPGDEFTPKINGKTDKDIDSLVRDWVGHDKPLSIFDVSELPSEILPTIVGTMLRVIYDMLFWGQDLLIGGRKQPLLVVLEEAHRFFSKKEDSSFTPAHRTLSMIAKEGRKYGMGLLLVSQRPSDIDDAVLSQSGSLIALRLSNQSDRNTVAANVPDDLGGIVDLLPSLRTGEGIFLGEIMPIPSRVQVYKATKKPIGDDPELLDAWQRRRCTDAETCILYEDALSNWREQSTSATKKKEKPNA